MDEIRSEFSNPTFVQLLPPSVDLNKPSPTETELRVQISPVPTQIISSGFLGSNFTTPMDCA